MFRGTSYLELLERNKSVIVKVMKPLQSKKQRQMTQLLRHDMVVTVPSDVNSEHRIESHDIIPL